MRVRSQEQATTAASTAAAPAPDTSKVACPECFQVGEHMDGCPEAGAPAAQNPAASPPATNGAHAPTVPRETTAAAPATRFPQSGPSDGEIGLVVSATWGDELYQPVQFNGVRVGPFTGQTIVRKGETTSTAMLRLYAELDVAATAIRDAKVAAYIVNLRRTMDAAAAQAHR